MNLVLVKDKGEVVFATLPSDQFVRLDLWILEIETKTPDPHLSSFLVRVRKEFGGEIDEMFVRRRFFVISTTTKDSPSLI